jgi:hypothetical protein
MRRTLISLSALLALAGCRSGIDCGAYVYDEARQICVCPAGTVELPGGGCAAIDGGGTDSGGVDAGIADGGADDAPHVDTGPTCAAETCNGTDDDCDGLIDEGVLTVGPAVTALTDATLLGGEIVPLGDGFGILAHTATTPSSFTWVTTGLGGLPVGSGVGLGSDTSQPIAFRYRVAVDPPSVLTTFVGDTTFPIRLIGFDSETGARTTGTIPFVVPVSVGRTAAGFSALVDVGSGGATVYSQEHDASSPDQFIVRRRLDVSVDPPRVVHTSEIATTLLGAWFVLTTNSAEFVFYREGDDLAVAAGPTGPGTAPFRTLGTIAGADVATAAIRDPSQPVSRSNPIGLVMHAQQPVGSWFYEITNTTILEASDLVHLDTSEGAPRDLRIPQTSAIIALPSTPDAEMGHWLVATVDNDPAVDSLTQSSAVQIREIVGAAVRQTLLVSPGESFAARTDIGFARSSGTVRLVEGGNTGGVVTRAVGCE